MDHETAARLASAPDQMTLRRTPHGSVFTYQSMFRLSYPLAAMMIALGQHTRAGIEENLWDTAPGKRLTSVQMIEKQVRIAKEQSTERGGVLPPRWGRT